MPIINAMNGGVPVHAHTESWILTYTGKKFYPLEPRLQDIEIEDIAHHLATTNRFTGAARVPYSIAEHSVRVSLVCKHEHALHGLLHDAAETYLGDVASPLKRRREYAFYRETEQTLQAMIYRRFGLDPVEPDDVKAADRLLLATEKRDLMRDHPDWKEGDLTLDVKIVPWAWMTAKAVFLDRFSVLMKRGAR